MGASHWQSIENMVSELCRVTLQSMPVFWRIAQNHASGKYTKETAILSSSIHTQSKAWALECVTLFVQSLRRFFSLESFRLRASKPLMAQLPSWVPHPCSSLSTTHYMNSILNTIADAVKELKALSIPGTFAQLQELLLDVRFHLSLIHI